MLREHRQLGEGMLTDLVAVANHHRTQNLCGLVYDVGMLLELPRELAEAIAVAADLLYCAFGMVDDIQDGDADDYLVAPWPQQLNVALPLRELAVLHLLDVIPAGPMQELAMRRVSTTVLEMALSQREELAAKAQGYRPPWDIDAYERVARGAAGAEVALLLFLVGVAVDVVGAAGVRGEVMAETLHRIGYPCGVALQIHVDSASRDERVTALPGDAVDELRRRQAELFAQDAPELPPHLVALLARIIGVEEEQSCPTSPSPTTPKPTSTKSKPKGSTHGVQRPG
jgi:hypothetical protein